VFTFDAKLLALWPVSPPTSVGSTLLADVCSCEATLLSVDVNRVVVEPVVETMYISPSAGFALDAYWRIVRPSSSAPNTIASPELSDAYVALFMYRIPIYPVEILVVSTVLDARVRAAVYQL
jgi:hypothetical protein